MTISPFAQSLVRKGERALRSAQLDLQDGDSDGAVNRAYYAMFNVARAALLSTGVSEDALPKTHRGVISAFGQHVVQSGQFDADLASVLSRTETLRLKADYTGTEIDAAAATQVVARAQTFVRTVEHAFGLEGLVTEPRREDESLEQSHRSVAGPLSIEDLQRQGREEWLRLRQDKLGSAENLADDLKRDSTKQRTSDLERDHGPEDDSGL